MLKNNYSKYFYILMIVIFIITVDCDETPPPTGKYNTYTLRRLDRFHVSAVKKFCESFDYVLADVDVVFNDISKINETDVEVFEKLENAKKKIIFYTTTMDKSYTDTLAQKLLEFDYNITIFTPISAFNWYFNSTGKVYVIGDDEFIDFVDSYDIDTISSLDSVSYDDYYNVINSTLDDEVKAVLIGFDLNINLYKISQAIRYLNKREVKLFLTHPKSIFLANYYKVWIKKLIVDTKKAKLYIDQLDGMFGNFLVEQNHLNDKVLAITTDTSGNRNFTLQHNYKSLLIGNWKVKKEMDLEQSYYKINNWADMPVC